MPRTPTLDAELLSAVRREVARLRGVNLFDLPPDRFAAAAIRIAVRDAGQGIVAANLDGLLGRPLDGAGRKAAHRAVARLAAAGRLEVLRLGPDGARMTHLRLVESTPGE